jgi:diamine N-acetyltransferase
MIRRARSSTVTLREVTDDNRDAIAALRVSADQERFVATVAKSLNDARANPESNPWFRAIYAGEQPVGFVMLGWDVKPQPGIYGPWFLWRLLIDRRHQGRGYGRSAMLQVIELIRSHGATELLTSYVPGDGSPLPFYHKLGFVPTGRMDEDEVELRLDLSVAAKMGQ